MVPDWIEPDGRESLLEYARRWGRQLREQIGDRPVCLGGVSMGGMLALEMAAVLETQCVILISSCRTRRAIDPGMLWFARLTSYLPLWMIDAIRRHLPDSFHEKLGPLSPDHTALTRTMFEDTSSARLRWGCRAMATWRGCGHIDVIPVRHIHGTEDELIRSSKVRPDQWIDGAGHAPTLTHPDVVNAFIEKCLDLGSA